MTAPHTLDTAPDTPVLALVGPTASGKTALSLPLAERLGGEIISMDSRQIYRGMDVGTAKATPTEQARVRHFGLDVVEPTERYSAARFSTDSREWIRSIRARGALPILVGGTGFFLRALTDPVFREPPLDRTRLESLRRWLDAQPTERLSRWVARLDPERAELAREGGRQRMGRTLEIALLSGHSLSWWHRHAPRQAPPLCARVVRLTVPREVLYDRINRRAEQMFRAQGLVDEVRGLLEAGVPVDAPGMTGTGYREAAAVLQGESSIDDAIDAVQRATRRYARRQETWFRHQLPDDRFELDATLPLDVQVDRVVRWWTRTAGDARG